MQTSSFEDSHVYPLESKRQVGIVAETTPGLVHVAFYGPDRNGHATSSVSAGDFVIINCEATKGVVGYITDLRLGDIQATSATDQVSIGTVQPLLTLDFERGALRQGIATRPTVGNKVFSVPPELVKLIADNRPQDQVDGGQQVSISLGAMLRNPDVQINHTPEMLFGRHLAVLGTSGGGKSWTVARLIEESSRFNCKIILFDATGEFNTLESGVHHVHLGTDPEAPKNSTEVVLPYFHLTETDLSAIFKPTGQSQGPKLRAAMKSLKLAIREPELAMDGVILKVHKSKQTYETAYRRHTSYIDRPNAEFDISALSRQIEAECVQPNRSALETQFWGDINGSDHASCMPLIGRIEDIIHNPALSSIFFPERRPSLLKAIDNFVSDVKGKVLRVSLQHLSFAHNAREIISNAIGRHILMRARDSKYRERPVVLFVDEAHQFLNNTVENDGDQYSLDSFAQIAKEGRKFGLNVCLATQRPRDIPEGVLSQVGTFIVHRLINHHDRTVVERASGEASSATIAMLPTLAPGEAVLLGVDFPVALTMRVHVPESEPHSRGPDYQKAWGAAE